MALAIQGQLFEDEVPLVRSCSALNEIRLADEIKELLIELKDGDRLYVHRIIVAARVPSLRETLRGPLTESNSVLKWPTVPLSIASAFFNYLYTGQVELTQSNARWMVILAKMMKLSDLENGSVRFMSNSVTLDNLATIWDFAKSLNIGPLEQTCMHLMKRQFNNFICSDLFVRLPADTVLNLLRADNLGIESEENVLAAIEFWVGPGKEDVNDRLKLHAPTLLREVRWLQTTNRFRIGLMQDHAMFQNSFGCTRFLGLVEQWIAAPDKDKPACPFNQQNRTHQMKKIREIQTHSASFVLFGEDKADGKWSVLWFDSKMRKKGRIADMEKRENASYSVVDESIFVVGGGTVQHRYSKRVDEFLVREWRWRRRASLAVGRRYHAAAVMTPGGAGKKLLGVFGGNNPEQISSCEVYDVTQDRWLKLPDLREKRSGPAAACLPGDSRFFVFGGFDGSSPLASVEFCQLEANWQARATAASTEDFWRPAASMRSPRACLAAADFRGRILVAGGYEGGNLKVVEMFSPPDASNPRGQWTELAAMQQSRCYFSLLTLPDAVFALGHDKEPKNTFETLTAPEGSASTGNDLAGWRWSSKDPVETLSRIWGAAVISG